MYNNDFNLIRRGFRIHVEKTPASAYIFFEGEVVIISDFLTWMLYIFVYYKHFLFTKKVVRFFVRTSCTTLNNNDDNAQQKYVLCVFMYYC